MIEPAPQPVWIGAKARWTEDGTRIEVPLSGDLGPRQALSILRALTESVGQVVADGVQVEVYQTLKEDRRVVRAPLVAFLASHLWATDPAVFRNAVDTGIRKGSEEYQAEASTDEELMAEWMAKLKSNKPD